MPNVDSWTQIHGWLSEAEGRKLQELARGKRVLEIGAYHGRSTVCMALVAEQVVSVDWHQGAEDIGFHDSLGPFLRNIDDYGVRDRVVTVVARHEDIRWLLRYGRYDLVFIDGDHSWDGIARDFGHACNLVRFSGAIAAHDYDHPKYPGVKQFLDAQGLDLEIVDSLAVMRF